jgi:2-methylcitrate dehydratase PrpD
MTKPSLLEHVLDLAALPAAALPDDAQRMAQLSLYDWIVVSLAGSNQPLANIVRDFVAAEAGAPVATVTGGNLKLPPRAAALANGTISHALDYDDTHFAYIGHPSVAIYPAALAAAEEANRSAVDLVNAFLVGAEAACRIGMVLGRQHYDAGFHQTATSGAFGATIAACRLYNMEPAGVAAALGLVSSRASGLKSQFGTMGKPFNAGAAASNGIEAAGLARRGFTASDDAFAGPQSFLVSHHADPDGASQIADWHFNSFVFADVRHKLHACCHGTHAMIEAILEILKHNDLSMSEVSGIRVQTAPSWMNVCNIKAPRTGLELKFSYGFLAAMVLKGVNLADYDSYYDALCQDGNLMALARKTQVIPNKEIAVTATAVEIDLTSGETIPQKFDLLAPLNHEQLAIRLQAKAAALIGPKRANSLWSMFDDLTQVSAADIARQLQE